MSRQASFPSRRIYLPKLLSITLVCVLIRVLIWRHLGFKIVAQESDCLSLVIPATPGGAQNNAHRLLRYMKSNMTWLPAEILLVSAGNRISSDLPQFRHIVADQIHNAAANRNIGGQEARCKYITFFDVDDVPHPARFENIELLIRRFTNVDALLFPFQFLQEGINIWEEQAAANQEPSCISMKGAHCNDPLYRSRKLYEMCYLEHWLENREPPFVLCCKDDYFTIAANGWLTVRKELFMELQYNSSMRIAEDGDLNARIIHSGGNLMIWDMKLGLYNFQRYKFISDRID